MNDEEFYTPVEVATRLKVTRQTIYNWIKSGELASVRAGRGRRVTPAALDDFMQRKNAILGNCETGLDQFAENFRLKHEAQHPEEVAAFMNSYPPEDREFAVKDWQAEFWSRYKDEIRQLWEEE